MIPINKILIQMRSSVKKMRYNTFGDYFIKKDRLVFQIVDHKKDIYTKLTLLHEMIEYFMLEYKGIPIDAIDEFDIAFEKDPDRVAKYGEPGADPSAPYRHEHSVAEISCQFICEQLGIDYEQYNNCLDE